MQRKLRKKIFSREKINGSCNPVKGPLAGQQRIHNRKKVIGSNRLVTSKGNVRRRCRTTNSSRGKKIKCNIFGFVFFLPSLLYFPFQVRADATLISFLRASALQFYHFFLPSACTFVASTTVNKPFFKRLAMMKFSRSKASFVA